MAEKETQVIEEVVAPQTPEETIPAAEEVVSAKDSGLDQTVSAVSSDSALFNRGETPDFNVEAEQKKQKAAKITKNVVVYLFLTICAVFAFLPFYWMIISSLKNEVEIRGVPTFFPTQGLFWANYKIAALSTGSEGKFVRVLVNTLVVGGISTVIGVVITVLTAYAFAKMNFIGKGILFSLMMATMMIPGELYTISNFVTVSAWKWNNSYTVLILPFLVSFYYIYLLRNQFMSIPNSLYQAAKVDGLSDMGYLLKVMVPLTAPTLTSITLLKFIATWNSYIWPRLVNTNTDWHMVTNWVTGDFQDQGRIIYGNGKYTAILPSADLTSVKMAAAFLVALPLLVLFICFRKYIMTGVSKSGTKG